ncbi:hypothetical protein Cni_G06267 [Canna indica]|uniref:Uncharacterized protein n=1 Tax=Canna indica TaxID=4628 RepID=A0AAQ3JYD9_9LILI|nr:hypothetical protein Cni_G06267 [Canna indica]
MIGSPPEGSPKLEKEDRGFGDVGDGEREQDHRRRPDRDPPPPPEPTPESPASDLQAPEAAASSPVVGPSSSSKEDAMLALLCANDSRLLLRTPSGTYPVATVDYADPHLVVTNPSMWSCRSSDVDGAVPPRRPANRPASPSLQLQQGRHHCRAQARLL